MFYLLPLPSYTGGFPYTLEIRSGYSQQRKSNETFTLLQVNGSAYATELWLICV
ncbi:UNVERIFIED_CONTAM: hypothetical protein FKN15_064265 [Acipenser sinensis]